MTEGTAERTANTAFCNASCAIATNERTTTQALQARSWTSSHSLEIATYLENPTRFHYIETEKGDISMPHTQPEQLATINTQKVAERFRSLHPIVALVSATRLMQYLEREGMQLTEHRALCADIIRSALPSLEAGPGNDPSNVPVLDGAREAEIVPSVAEPAIANGITDDMVEAAALAPPATLNSASVAAGASEPATVHDKPRGMMS